MGITQQIGASSLIKPGVCTSSTRPASPYEGQAIYETDTDKVLVYNGTAWYPNWNTAWGQVGLQTLTSIFTTSATHTTFQDNAMTLTINEVSGRIYQITAYSNLYPSAGLQGTNLRILRAATTLKQANFSSTVMDAGVGFAVVVSHTYTSVASGSATYKVQIAALTSNTAVTDYADATFPRQFVITDIGPA